MKTPPTLRTASLTLTLGFVLGFSVHALLIDQPEWLARGLGVDAPPVVQPVARRSNRPISYPDAAKVIAELQRRYDEAVVVVLADETVDHERQLVNRTVVEVWKGPASLTGKPMNSKIERKLSYENMRGTQRALLFLPLTSFVTSSSSTYFFDSKLGMNPVLTIDDVRMALTAQPTGVARR